MCSSFSIFQPSALFTLSSDVMIRKLVWKIYCNSMRTPKRRRKEICERWIWKFVYLFWHTQKLRYTKAMTHVFVKGSWTFYICVHWNTIGSSSRGSVKSLWERTEWIFSKDSSQVEAQLLNSQSFCQYFYSWILEKVDLDADLQFSLYGFFCKRRTSVIISPDTCMNCHNSLGLKIE